MGVEEHDLDSMGRLALREDQSDQVACVENKADPVFVRAGAASLRLKQNNGKATIWRVTGFDTSQNSK